MCKSGVYVSVYVCVCMFVCSFVCSCIHAFVRASVRASERACVLASASVKVIEVISEKWTHCLITCIPLSQRTHITIF